MSVDVQQPQQPAPAPKAPTLRERASLFLVALSFYFQLPIHIKALADNQTRLVGALQAQAAIMNQLNARVNWYEKRVPFIAKEYNAFRHQEKKLLESAQAQIDYEERERRRAEMAVAQ
jgi:hypothetical protein